MIHQSINSKWIYTYDYAPDSVWEKWREYDGIPAWIEVETNSVTERINTHSLHF